MQELANKGADVTVRSESPLFYAIYHQNAAAFQLLLQHGLSVDSIFHARLSRRLRRKHLYNMYALLCAALPWKSLEDGIDSVPLVRELVARGAGVYRPLTDSTTVIHFLFQWAETDIQDALMHQPCRSRIDFDRDDQRGQTLMMAACEWRGM